MRAEWRLILENFQAGGGVFAKASRLEIFLTFVCH
jgi:hypothetical protein